MRDLIHIHIHLLLLLVLGCGIFCNNSAAQPVLPQRSITVNATQPIHFGVFYVGTMGGSVVLNYDGSRSATGDIALLPITPIAQPAIFEIKLCQGRNVNISIVPTITLNGSNGGTLTLDLGPTEKGDIYTPFPTDNDCDFITTLRVGGTLNVPGGGISGTYSGSFSITFNQE